MDEHEALLTALQIGDSFFPSGAFAYSSGLETYVFDGRVADRVSLTAFIESYLVGLVARCDLLFVRLSHTASRRSDPDEIGRLDHLLHAMKLPAELRAASMQMGRQFLQAMIGLYPSSVLQSLLRNLEARNLDGHHPVIFGAVCGATGIKTETTLLTYLYSTVSSLVGAGVRLIPLGPSDGQIAINHLKSLITRIAKEAEHLGEEDIAGFAPSVEIHSMQHEHLPVRLFKS